MLLTTFVTTQDTVTVNQKSVKPFSKRMRRRDDHGQEEGEGINNMGKVAEMLGKSWSVKAREGSSGTPSLSVSDKNFMGLDA